MVFVTQIRLSSGDWRTLSDTINELKTILNKKGVEYDGPHSAPSKTFDVPMYKQLCPREEFQSWSYEVYARSIEIYGSNQTVREIMSYDFTDSVHVEVNISQSSHQLGKDTNSSDYRHQQESEDMDQQSNNEEQDSISENSLRHTDVNSPSTTESEANLESLRRRAIKDSVNEVTEYESSTSETTQYTRSNIVRSYVMSRAGGECEGCGEPAPFTSKTGEPYLHAHHIHELSDGGSDTPDTVIALCPNCHYRVHHGKDGEKYNKELLRIVQDKENSSA